ncbi:MAG: aspartate--tRNA ligase [Alphaproteobacteria bacterium]|nr:aspartate--tRNA ligase [Alphaproteobacteria bacterium]
MHAYRTHSCGALRLSDEGQTARLSGWVHRKRDHGQLLFIDLRDHYGITQCVIDVSSPLFAAADSLRLESVVTATGRVVARSAETVNPNLASGEVELVIDELVVQSAAEPLPLPVNTEAEYPEDMRLRYRFLDLRREQVHANIMLRSRVIASIRQRMIAQGFAEFQTPILTASSPEGARDYLVPSRLHPGSFYALPQAPQQFKQLLMVAGFDRYFQIAPCFRDEASRADRSPGEFYQLDFEMSFVTQEDVFAAIEPVLHGVFEEFGGGRPITPPPFPRIAYRDALLRYGTDKPDLRNPIEIADVSDVFVREDIEFKAFKSIVQDGGVVRAIPAPGAGTQPRSFFDRLNEWARAEGAPGLGYIVFEAETVSTPGSVAEAVADAMQQHGLGPKEELSHLRFLQGRGPIARFLSTEAVRQLAAKSGVKAGDALFFSAGVKSVAEKLAGMARTRIGSELGLIAEGEFRFCWITDFPMYELNEETGKVEFSHNPFSMPQGGLEALETADPLTINAYQYDIVCNGVELSSGAIRNHRPDIMYKAFAIAGYSAADVEARFGGMLNAFQYGAPPHGGSAPGIDRIVMLLANTPNIREVVAFPMNQQAQDLLMQAPAPVPPERLKELHIRLDLPTSRGSRG